MQLILLERSEEKRNEYEQKKVRKMCRANQCLQGQNNISRKSYIQEKVYLEFVSKHINNTNRGLRDKVSSESDECN